MHSQRAVLLPNPDEDEAPPSGRMLRPGDPALAADTQDGNEDRSSFLGMIMPERRASAAQRIVAALKEAGINTYFGVPGGPISPLCEAVLGAAGVRLIESRHESSAVFSAMGYFRATGQVPGVLVTAGPGATNAVTGIAAAHSERVPMVVICGDVAWAATGGRMAQDSGPEGFAVEHMMAKITRASLRASRADTAATQGMAAFQAATSPLRPGPALLVVPMDIGCAEAPSARTPIPAVQMEAPAPRAVVWGVAELLARAERPLVVVGNGARTSAAAVRRLLGVLNVPFMTTPQAKGLISEEHPRSLRHGGLAASWWARRYTGAGVDAALVLGTDLDDSSVATTLPIAPGGALVHVDLDPSVFHRNFPAETAVIADVGAFADALYDVVTREGRRNRHGAALTREVRRRSPFDEPGFASDGAQVIAPHRAIADLQAAAGEGARFVSDIGEHMLFALHYLTARERDAFTIHLGLGSMASGICSAIGLALGDPSRRVVCICGDGGMQMAGMEALVAVEHRLPIVYAVFNDARYNMVYHGYRQLYAQEASWRSPWVDFVQWGRSLGMAGMRVDRPGEITSKVLDELTAHGPAVLDIRIDREVRIRGAGRNEVLGQMSQRAPGAPGRAAS